MLTVMNAPELANDEEIMSPQSLKRSRPALIDWTATKLEVLLFQVVTDKPYANKRIQNAYITVAAT